mgnify:FL=1
MAFDVFTSAPNFQHTFHFWRIAQATHPLGNVIFLISTRYYLPINVFILFRGALFFFVLLASALSYSRCLLEYHHPA